MNFKIADSKFKELLLPTLLIVMALNVSAVVDSFFVGTFIGKNAVAALEVLEPMILLITVVEWLFGLGGQILALNKKSEFDILKAYIVAKRLQKMYDLRMYTEQLKLIENSWNKNILIVSHPYIGYDNMLGKPVIDYLKKSNINICYADINSSKVMKSKNNRFKYKEISKAIYWRHNKELLNGIVEYKDKVDGIIYLSVFPCGTDSLTNDISIRKVNHIPTLNIVLDEQKANAGVITRLESFIDIIEQESKVSVNE